MVLTISTALESIWYRSSSEVGSSPTILEYDSKNYVNSYLDTLISYSLPPIITSPTRISSKTATLIDHIYTNNPSAVSDVCVPVLSVSDHFPVTCCWSIKLPKLKKNAHTSIIYS